MTDVLHRAARPLPPAALAVLALVGGCTGPGPDTSTPVPTEASGEYLCPGVPGEPVPLMTGQEEIEVGRQTGSWGEDGMFVCSLEDSDGEMLLTVTEQDLASASTSLEALRDENPDHLVIESGPVRGGVAYQSGNRALARFVCAERFLSVEVFAVPEGRDGADDVSRYLTSMLPWACGDAPAPE